MSHEILIFAVCIVIVFLSKFLADASARCCIKKVHWIVISTIHCVILYALAISAYVYPNLLSAEIALEAALMLFPYFVVLFVPIVFFENYRVKKDICLYNPSFMFIALSVAFSFTYVLGFSIIASNEWSGWAFLSFIMTLPILLIITSAWISIRRRQICPNSKLGSSEPLYLIIALIIVAVFFLLHL